MKELIVIIAGIAIIAAIVFVMVRGAKKIHREYKIQPQRKIPIQAIQGGLGLCWAVAVYQLGSKLGLGYKIAIPIVTVGVLALYYAVKKDLTKENAEQKVKKE